jgi:uncharacterized membrane protein
MHRLKPGLTSSAIFTVHHARPYGKFTLPSRFTSRIGLLMSKTLIVAFAVTAVVFLVLDAIWLGVISRNIYQREIGALLLAKPNFGAAAIFYVIYIIGMVYFCAVPGIAENSVMRGLISGALFGVVAYATYDLTNLATLKGWSTTLVFIDIAWGAFASAVATAAAVAVTTRVVAVT